MIFNRRPKTPQERGDTAIAAVRAANSDESALNTPKYRAAMEDLSTLDPAAVPVLIAALRDALPERYEGPGNDFAEALGAIGDPRAVDVLMEAGQQFIANGPRALSKFPEGVQVLLAGLDDPDEHVRVNCIDGLAYGGRPPANLCALVMKMLSDESPWVRRTAAQVVCGQKIRDRDLANVLLTVMREDPDETVRKMAENALHVAGAS